MNPPKYHRRVSVAELIKTLPATPRPVPIPTRYHNEVHRRALVQRLEADRAAARERDPRTYEVWENEYYLLRQELYGEALPVTENADAFSSGGGPTSVVERNGVRRRRSLSDIGDGPGLQRRRTSNAESAFDQEWELVNTPGEEDGRIRIPRRILKAILCLLDNPSSFLRTCKVCWVVMLIHYPFKMADVFC
jgi:hypothetical protein